MIETRTFRAIAAGTAAGRKTREESSVFAKIALKIARRVKVQCAVYFISFYIVSAMLASSAPTFLLAFVFPAISFILSGIYGIKYGYISHYIAIPVILFIPASFIFFENSLNIVNKKNSFFSLFFLFSFTFFNVVPPYNCQEDWE